MYTVNQTITLVKQQMSLLSNVNITFVGFDTADEIQNLNSVSGYNFMAGIVFYQSGNSGALGITSDQVGLLIDRPD